MIVGDGGSSTRDGAEGRRRGQDRGAIPVQPDKMMKTSTDVIELAKESFFRTDYDEQKSRFVCEHGFVIRKTKY